MASIKGVRRFELADIVREHKNEYLKKYRSTYGQRKVLRALENCRTAILGGHKDACVNCGEVRVSYNSCRNRHCPKCQFTVKERWLEKQRQNMLPIQYFHVVFTIPAELNNIFYANQKICYNLLFKAVKETLLTISADEKYLGAKPGFLAVLHTWGQNLLYHPHLHCIVTGGGLTKDGEWKNCRSDYFLPVQVLSDLFKKKLLFYLKKAFRQERIKNTETFSNDLPSLYKKKWVVYCKKPFASAEKVLCYLGRYTHRVAISNGRIKSIENSFVSFSYKDYRSKGKRKIMKIAALEFLRRFLLHVLPKGFVKIRAYGLLSNQGKKILLLKCRDALNTCSVPESTHEKTLDFDARKCPVCKEYTMQTIEELPPLIPKFKARPP